MRDDEFIRFPFVVSTSAGPFVCPGAPCVSELCSFHGFAVHTELSPKFHSNQQSIQTLDPLPVLPPSKGGRQVGPCKYRSRYIRFHERKSTVGIQTSTDFVRASNDPNGDKFERLTTTGREPTESVNNHNVPCNLPCNLQSTESGANHQSSGLGRSLMPFLRLHALCTT